MLVSRRTFVTAALAAPFLAPPGFAADGPLKLRDLYVKGGDFSDLARSLEGERITLEGYMAPPLKAEASFFVLTKMPMATCPFCEPGIEWPDNILPVYTRRTVDVIPFNVPMLTRGRLEMGEFTDPDTGFWSIIRLAEATYERQ
ncbi:hypothetical protein PSM7751_00939 [Pseudooceanicola marinus]|uniref:Uncharacterized protein n=1 Tax=Pseudooceanicola marinus TaxID=396013 RepID=A0A1X6YMS6_9RHOB|nr:hypothetical protein [Pseudooceanicola marinus]PJE29425.1 hypothetical protein CVM50_13025 [Pseudooceanicola marinus]SLN25957.1 hypothetical protein PSM7751_00939 [Pseudooceanicola marinus]